MKEVIPYLGNKEGWRPIKDFEHYFISSEGRIIKTATGKILKQHENHKGYYVVQLSNKGEKKNFRVHRLVAQTFIPNPDNLPEVDHKDRDRKNNHVDNLQWVSGSANTRNTSKCINSTSKYNGVSFHQASGKWRASIRVDRKNIHLGSFDTETTAALAFNFYCLENKLNRELNNMEV